MVGCSGVPCIGTAARQFASPWPQRGRIARPRANFPGILRAAVAARPVSSARARRARPPRAPSSLSRIRQAWFVTSGPASRRSSRSAPALRGPRAEPRRAGGSRTAAGDRRRLGDGVRRLRRRRQRRPRDDAARRVPRTPGEAVPGTTARVASTRRPVARSPR